MANIVRSNQTPVGIRIISIFFYVQATLSLLMGFLLIVRSETLFRIWESIMPGMGSAFYNLFFGVFSLFASELLLTTHIGLSISSLSDLTLLVMEGIVFISSGTFLIFVGKDLLKKRKWSRITSIILSCGGVVGSLIFMPHIKGLTMKAGLGAIGVISNLIIFLYLIHQSFKNNSCLAKKRFAWDLRQK